MKKGIVDLTEHVTLQIDGNKLPHALLSICKIAVCPSIKHTMNPGDVVNLTESMIAGLLCHIVDIWNENPEFRQIVGCLFISNSQLDTLCDIKNT